MELREISIYEAKDYDLPAGEPGPGVTSTWYALDDEDVYKGFMEVTYYEDDDFEEITYFMVPDLYQGNNYGNIMLTLFLDQYIPQSTADDLLTTSFEYNTGDGEVLAQIFSDHGFDIALNSYRECSMPFEAVYKKLASKKAISYKGRMANFTECINDVVDELPSLRDYGITLSDLREADIEKSVAAINNEGKLEALMLVNVDVDAREAIVTDLYTATDDPTILRRFLAFAVYNAARSSLLPEIITFVAANEKLEQVMDTLFENPPTSDLVMAEAEFNLGKYVEQLKLLDTLRR